MTTPTGPRRALVLAPRIPRSLPVPTTPAPRPPAFSQEYIQANLARAAKAKAEELERKRSKARLRAKRARDRQKAAQA